MDRATEAALRDCTMGSDVGSMTFPQVVAASPLSTSSATTPTWCVPRRPITCPTEPRTRLPATPSTRHPPHRSPFRASRPPSAPCRPAPSTKGNSAAASPRPAASSTWSLSQAVAPSITAAPPRRMWRCFRNSEARQRVQRDAFGLGEAGIRSLHGSVGRDPRQGAEIEPLCESRARPAVADNFKPLGPDCHLDRQIAANDVDRI